MLSSNRTRRGFMKPQSSIVSGKTVPRCSRSATRTSPTSSTCSHSSSPSMQTLMAFQDDANNDGIPDERLVAGPGNIGDGTSDVARVQPDARPLKPFGIEGGELKATGVWQNGEVTDPLTGDKRRISGQRPQTLNINFRQDLPEQKLTWGLGWFGGVGRGLLPRLRKSRACASRNFFSSFIEYKPTTNFTLAGRAQQPRSLSLLDLSLHL